jgi:hypothetical protein
MSSNAPIKREVGYEQRQIERVRSLPKVEDPLFDDMMRTLGTMLIPTLLFPNPPRKVALGNQPVIDLIHMHDRYYTYSNGKYVNTRNFK